MPTTFAPQQLIAIGFLVLLSACAAKGPKPADEIPPSVARVAANSCIAITSEPPPVDDTLILKSIEPVAGSAVDRNSSIKVTLEYSARDYVAGQYFLIAQFLTTQNYTTDGDIPNDQYPFACGSRGVFTLTYPVKYIWETPNVRKPLQIKFQLNSGTFSSSRGVAFTAATSFPTQD
jgi:hypothetical protein